jgi:hypothetical protein
VFGERGPDTADPPQSVEIQEWTSPHSIRRDAFGDRRRYALQRVDLGRGGDVEVQLSIDVAGAGTWFRLLPPRTSLSGILKR